MLRHRIISKVYTIAEYQLSVVAGNRGSESPLSRIVHEVVKERGHGRRAVECLDRREQGAAEVGEVAAICLCEFGQGANGRRELGRGADEWLGAHAMRQDLEEALCVRQQPGLGLREWERRGRGLDRCIRQGGVR